MSPTPRSSIDWELGPTAEKANPVLLPEPQHLPRRKGRGAVTVGAGRVNKEAECPDIKEGVQMA